MDKTSVFGNVISGIIGGVAFFFFFLILSLPIWLAIIIAVACYVGSFLIFGTQTKTKLEVEMDKHGVTPEMVNAAISEGKKKVSEISALGAKIQKKEVKQNVADIVGVCEKIFEDFKKDPKDIKQAKQFLSYYLDATINILKRYVDLSLHQTKNAELTQTLAKVESLLGTIKTAFEKQLVKLLEDDVMDLDVEISLLEKTMKMEG